MALHPLRGGAPEQKRCIAYGSGVAPQHTGTNAELAHRTTHRHTPPCAAGPNWRQDGHAAHATTCTPAHSDTSYTLKCEEPEKGTTGCEPVAPFRVAQDLAQDARQEVPGGLLARIINHLLRRALLDNLAVAQEHDAVGRLAGEADLVRRHEDG